MVTVSGSLYLLGNNKEGIVMVSPQEFKTRAIKTKNFYRGVYLLYTKTKGLELFWE